MGEADVRSAAGHVAAVLLEAGRAEGTVRRHQVVLDRFAVGSGMSVFRRRVQVEQERFILGAGQRALVISHLYTLGQQELSLREMARQ